MRNLINTKIVLTREEQKICEYIGKSRYLINREKGVTDKKIGNKDNKSIRRYPVNTNNLSSQLQL